MFVRNMAALVGLMRQTAQDAGVGRFEHILLCTDSMAEATVQTLPVRNCVVCSIAYPSSPFQFSKLGDIRENFDTSECPNIFVSTKLHE